MKNKESMKFDYKRHTNLFNGFMCELVENLTTVQPLPFNSNLAFATPNEARDSLVASRILNKFEKPEKGKNIRLRQDAFTQYKEYDRKLGEIVLQFDYWKAGSQHLHLRKAAAFLSKVFRGFSIDYSECDLEFTPGETYVPSGGKTSIISKLKERKHWTTTLNCLEETCLLIYNNTSLKRCAKELIGPISRAERKSYFLEAMQTYGLVDLGFHVFSALLIDRVLTIVPGARASTVPKNNEKDRFINVEAMFPMLLQRLVSREIKKRLAKFGLILNSKHSQVKHVSTSTHLEHDAQRLHGQLISNSYYATIDFSNASDSVIAHIAYVLVGNDLAKYLQKLRSSVVIFDDGPYTPVKLSSMGNGFTFEVMSSILFAIGKTFTDSIWVFGDDVILPNSVAHSFLGCCELIGFNANMKKTFIDSPLRESCGSFFHDSLGYLTSFDFKWCETYQDTVITMNKIQRLLGQSSYDDIFIEFQQKAKALFLAEQKGPIPDSYNESSNLALYVWDENWKRKHRSSTSLKGLRDKYITAEIGELIRSWHRDVMEFAFVMIPVYRVLSVSGHVSRAVRLSTSLYAGRKVTDQIKGRGKWIHLPAVVDKDGTVTFVRSLRRISRSGSDIGLQVAITSHEKPFL